MEVSNDSKERYCWHSTKKNRNRLPATVHQWQGYHLDEIHGRMSDLEH